MATDPRVETIGLLRSIDVTLKAMLLVLSEARSGTPAAPTPNVDLDGQYGDPVVKTKDPKNWAGESQRGKRFSECPPAYLDQFAERCDYFVTRNTEALKDAADDAEEAKLRKDIKYGTLDRDRARGWAARLRGGWKSPASSQSVNEEDSEPGW